jgi:hypothetical protein
LGLPRQGAFRICLTSAIAGRRGISGRFIIFWPHTVPREQGRIYLMYICYTADSSCHGNPDSGFYPYPVYTTSLALYLTHIGTGTEAISSGCRSPTVC